jgi:glycosyltransferase involved in cell wall biosynthesis
MRSLTDYTEVSDSARLSTDPKVSVVMIAYAQEDVLSDAVESVAAQRTSFPFEIILSEDCSPDRTRDVALSLQR